MDLNIPATIPDLGSSRQQAPQVPLFAVKMDVLKSAAEIHQGTGADPEKVVADALELLRWVMSSEV